MSDAKNTEEKPKIDVRQLADVANRVELTAINLLQLSCKGPDGVELADGTLVMDYEYKTAARRRDTRPGFDVRFDLKVEIKTITRAKGEGAVGASSVVACDLSYALEYRLPEVAPQDWNERIGLFAQVNGVVNAWPYARQEFASLLAKMGLPPLLLPVYRPGRPTKARIEFEPLVSTARP